MRRASAETTVEQLVLPAPSRWVQFEPLFDELKLAPEFAGKPPGAVALNRNTPVLRGAFRAEGADDQMSVWPQRLMHDLDVSLSIVWMPQTVKKEAIVPERIAVVGLELKRVRLGQDDPRLKVTQRFAESLERLHRGMKNGKVAVSSTD